MPINPFRLVAELTCSHVRAYSLRIQTDHIGTRNAPRGGGLVSGVPRAYTAHVSQAGTVAPSRASSAPSASLRLPHMHGTGHGAALPRGRGRVAPTPAAHVAGALACSCLVRASRLGAPRR